MSSLQKVNLGTPPTAVDGDTSRGANTKMNANVDVLNAQAAIVSYPGVITASQNLTVADHLGKRVNINFAAAAAIGLPPASTCGADSVLLLRNLGTAVVTVVVTAGSGDTVNLTTLAAGESALFDTDGVHAWRALIRGRALSETAYMPLGGGAFSGAPTYSTPAVAQASYKNVAAGKVVVFANKGRQDFSTTSATLGGWTPVTSSPSGVFDGNTFFCPIAGVFRFRANVAIGSGPAAGNTVDVGVWNALNTANIFGRNRTATPNPSGAIFTCALDLVVTLAAGAQVQFYIVGSGAMYTIADSSFTSMSIEQIS